MWSEIHSKKKRCGHRDVVVNYRSHREEAERISRTIRAFGVQSFPFRAEVNKERHVSAMFKKMIKEFGTIDILVNNAGIQNDAPIEKMTVQDWRQVLNVNLDYITGETIYIDGGMTLYPSFRSAG